MTPEILKRIAEKVGYNYVVIQDSPHLKPIKQVKLFDLTKPKGQGQVVIFNPAKNPAQLLEVIEWLLKCGWDIGYVNDSGYRMRHMGSPFRTLESFSEAILTAAASEV